MKDITHLIFAGCGLRTITVLGVIQYLYCYKLNEKIRNVIGTSMGAYFGLGFALKIPFEELESMIKNAIKDDDNTIIKNEDLKNLFIKNGLDNTSNYLNIFKKYIKEKYNQDDITFIELSKKTGINLYVSCTNINLCKNIIFNVNDTPNISVLTAVAASMSLPLMSEPVLIDGYYYLDGGLTNNFPIEIFKDIPKENILGVVNNMVEDYKLFEDIPKNSDISFIDFNKQLLNLFIINTNKTALNNKINDKNNEYIISIMINNSANKTIGFEISRDHIKKVVTDEEVDILILIGFKEMFEFMNKFNNESKMSTLQI